MHPYATDSSERRTVPILFAIAAVASAWQLPKVVEHLQLQALLWWADLPAVWGFYVLYWGIFEKWLWTWPLLRFIRLVRVPDLRGEWVGEGVSSYDDGGGKPTPYDMRLTIRQEWTRCSVRMETGHSRSDSTIAAVLVEHGGRPRLSYEYQNQPGAHAAGTMHAHPGMTRLEMIDETHVEGEYYTGRDRRSYGTMRLTRRAARPKKK